MTLYHIDEGGIEFIPHNLFLELDKSLREGAPSFQDDFPLTADGFRQIFLGTQGHAYDYLLEARAKTPLDHLLGLGAEFWMVTHPQVTSSCQDKIDMYNQTGCSVDGNMDGPRKWQLQDTIKAIYFFNKRNGKYHVAVVPGKPSEQHINIRTSFKEVCAQLEANIRKAIRVFPADTQLVFEAGLEGCLSPLIPDYVAANNQMHLVEPMVEAVYFDENHLVTYSEHTRKLDDLSIALSPIHLDGKYVEKLIGKSHAELLRQVVKGVQVPLEIITENDQQVAHVDGQIVGDYRDATTQPQAGEEPVLLKFSYIPNHMMSLLMSYRDVYELLKRTLPDKVFAVDMQYKGQT